LKKILPCFCPPSSFEITCQILKHKDSSGRPLKHTTKPGNALDENKPGYKGHKEDPKPLGECIKDFFRPEDNDPEHLKPGNRGSKDHDHCLIS
jgi:hypothetical protein